ncbi:hypothetical protein NKR19_g3900 [Coniochaeta hoffmannii]|uniref:Heterokaryon incompatibility domain-containing protein n=1 Tax=Coniochaeta hoffmannii TaxID=91930 RepID=A0AA38SEJ3_9PEZI|nr:hypothetical protein NKR19_g3900 [Coniochaeta hoffmannii]
MGDIYRQAKRVVSYLGKPHKASQTSHFIHELVLHQIRYNFSFIRKRQSYLPYQSSWAKWRLIRRLARNEYWSRIWMVQEFSLPDDLLLIYENAAIPWACLSLVDSIREWTMMAGDESLDYLQKLDPATVHLEHFKSLLRTRDAMQSEERPAITPQAIATEFRHLSATLPQDKVYGLLGLYGRSGTAGTIQSLKPDYNKSAQQVYVDLAKLALETRSYMLFACAGASHERHETGLPSWAPDLTCPATTANERFYHRGYSSGGDQEPSFDIIDQKTLRIRGYMIDTIKACSPEMLTFRELDAIHGNVQTLGWVLDKMRLSVYFLTTIQQIAAQEPPYTYAPSNQSRDEALWRTLIQDYDESSFPADPAVVSAVANSLTAKQKIMLEKGQSLTPQNVVAMMGGGPRGPGHARDVAAYAHGVCFQHKFALSEKGYMALVPPKTAPGDVLCAFQGFPVPFVLRPNGSGYVLWGDGYVHGFMAGEATRGEARWLDIV